VTVRPTIEGTMLSTTLFSLLETCEAYHRTLGTPCHYLIRSKTHPQASGRAFASFLKRSVIDLCLPLSSSREQAFIVDIHQLNPIDQMLRRITFWVDLLVYTGRNLQALLHSSDGKRPTVRIV
jgi:hypothetical protein